MRADGLETAVRVATILDSIDVGSIALPEFQRGYVWNREQVRSFMLSLYRKYPVGSLLVWITPTESAKARGPGELAPGVVKLLLDGQQRCTTLYGIIRGQPPKFFDGATQAFTGLYFHLEDEVVEFYAPAKMQADPRWIDISALFKTGLAAALQRILADPQLQANAQRYINRLNAITTIADVDLHIEEVVGTDKTLDVVVDIFNRVNSGGTKLSKGDLALARLGAMWPQVREEMKKKLRKYEQAGFYFRLEWLLRAVNAVLTGQAFFTALEHISAEDFKAALQKTERHLDYLLNLIAGRLGLDHDRVLSSRYSLPLLARYLEVRGGRLTDHRERDKLLYWYIHTLLWGRYSGSTETILGQDLNLVADAAGALDRLIAQLRQVRGDLRVQPGDFLGASRGARFYPLLYMLTRVWQAKDWKTGTPLHGHMLGTMSRLELHHIFPGSQLKKKGFKVAERNALANFTFLTKETNLEVTNRLPTEYLPAYAERNPAVIESHWIPMDPKLWQIDRYPEFLAARRELVAKAANEFLDSLLGGALPARAEDRAAVISPDGSPVRNAAREQEDRVIEKCRAWLQARGLPTGDRNYELLDADTGEALATIDLAWPEGLQEGLSQPVALLLDEPDDIHETVATEGYRCFTEVESFQDYVHRRVLASEEDEDEEDDAPATPESWSGRVADEALKAIDAVLLMVNTITTTRFGVRYELSYRKYFIGLTDGSNSRNFVSFRPRRRFLRIGARVGATDVGGLIARLDAAGAKADVRDGRLRVNVAFGEVERLRPLLAEIVTAAAVNEHSMSAGVKAAITRKSRQRSSGE